MREVQGSGGFRVYSVPQGAADSPSASLGMTKRYEVSDRDHTHPQHVILRSLRRRISPLDDVCTLDLLAIYFRRDPSPSGSG